MKDPFANDWLSATCSTCKLLIEEISSVLRERGDWEAAFHALSLEFPAMNRALSTTVSSVLFVVEVNCARSAGRRVRAGTFLCKQLRRSLPGRSDCEACWRYDRDCPKFWYEVCALRLHEYCAYIIEH